MNSPLPVINTVLLIANLAIAGFIINNSGKIMKSQDEIAQRVAIGGRDGDSELVRKGDLDSAVSEIMGINYVGPETNLVGIKRSIDSMNFSIQSCILK